MRSVSATYLRNEDKLTESVDCKGPSFTNQLLNNTCETMGSLPPPSPSQLRSPSRDTGFPASFDGRRSLLNHTFPTQSPCSPVTERNTTLPHPDADLSPNASISADDIAIGRVLSRQRRSFLAKHRRTVSHGVITPEMERTHSGNLVLLREENEPPLLSTVDSKRSQQSRSSTNHDGASFASSDESGVHVRADGTDMSPTSDKSFESPGHGTKGHGHKRRRSLLTRLMHR